MATTELHNCLKRVRSVVSQHNNGYNVSYNCDFNINFQLNDLQIINIRRFVLNYRLPNTINND